MGVKAIVIDAEDPKMRNRIKNICKKLREKKKAEKDKKSGAGKDKDDDDGSDMGHDESDDDDLMDVDVRMTNKTPLVMKEGVVDFLNPSDVAKSFISELKMNYSLRYLEK